jgi:hypothetical protein
VYELVAPVAIKDFHYSKMDPVPWHQSKRFNSSMMMRALCNKKEKYIIFCQEMEEDKSKMAAQDSHIPSSDNRNPCEVRVTRD